MRVSLIMLSVLLFGSLVFAGNDKSKVIIDTLHLQSEQRDVPIPFTKKDTTVTVSAATWKVVSTLAASLDGCKQDWNQLLTLGIRKDSLCQASLAEVAQQRDLQADRNQNYQSSWTELMADQQKCSQALGTCTDAGLQQNAELERLKDRKSYWWAWLVSGIAIGLLGGVAITQ